MKEKFEIFKNEKIVINVRSQKQYDDFMKMCKKQGLQWNIGDLPTKIIQYYYNKENTCINLNNLKCLSYCDINFYKNCGYKIITYKDFMKGELNQFTKSDLKDNHIITLRNGDTNMWKGNYKNYNENLISVAASPWDIVEVYEFETLVWEREEKPVEILDKVEKEYLSYVIRPFKNKIIWIKKDTFNYNSNEEWIDIETNKDGMTFPNFKKGTMYKGMEIDKEYTLKELGLE